MTQPLSTLFPYTTLFRSSILCDTTSWPALIILSSADQVARTSGINVSIVVSGHFSLTALTVWYHISAPRSLSSSRLTEVMTACFTCMRKIASATRLGSSSSYSRGRPVLTAQHEQDRVHTYSSIIKVAIPAPQHSPILGQLPR